jgi:hypothetical protein
MRVLPTSSAFLLLLVTRTTTTVDAWTLPVRQSPHSSNVVLLSRAASLPTKAFTTKTSSLFAGFGGSDESSKSKKLSPKQQWDRYLSFKQQPKVQVAVRKIGSEEWLEVGAVRSENNAMTELAVVKQRALIAEVNREDG